MPIDTRMSAPATRRLCQSPMVWVSGMTPLPFGSIYLVFAAGYFMSYAIVLGLDVAGMLWFARGWRHQMPVPAAIHA